MRLGLRIFGTMAVAFSLLPALCAEDTAKPAATAKKDGAVNSRVAPGIVAKAKLAVTTSASLPAPAMPKLGGADGVTPRVELFLGYSFLRNAPTSTGNRLSYLHGGSTSLALNLNRHLGLVGDFGYFHADRFGPGAPPNGREVNASGNVFTYMGGPRLSLRNENSMFTPFAQALVGGVHASAVTLSGCSGIGCTPLPSENGFALAAGGGLDITLSRHIAMRAFQAEYMMTRFADPTSSGGKTARQNDVRISAGLVFRFGGNPPPPPPPPPNHPPVTSCSADKSMVFAESGDVVAVRTQASDPDNDPLTYSWTTTGGAVEGSGPEVRWNSSGVTPGTYTVRVRVDDGRGGTADCSADVRVERRPNRPPTMSCSADRSSSVVGQSVQITATASDPDNDPLTFSWRASGGRTIGSGSSVRFDSSGLAPGRYTVTGRVDDGRGGTADCSVDLDVQAPPLPPVVKELEARLALHSIYFPTAQPTTQKPNGGLMESQQTILRTLAEDFKKYLEFKPDAHLILAGHADQRGTVEYNNALTERRVGRTKSFLAEQGVPAASIETRSLGKQENLDAARVRQMIEQNPDLTPEDRRKLLTNLRVITLANNRRVDVVLSTTGQQSTRLYPFNAKDALTLINEQRTGTAKRTAPAAKRKPKKQ